MYDPSWFDEYVSWGMIDLYKYLALYAAMDNYGGAW
jgi:hypothetical protein